MITTQTELHELVERARRTDAVALDTEFIWERTYYPRLGLIQLALSDEDCFLIDPIALQDLSNLGDLLADPQVVKIFHDAPQDLAILSRATGSSPKNIFDTRLAAGFTGLTATLSLCNLVKILLDIDLKKTETRTNWLKRPLAPEQIAYALDDVRYLRAVRILILSSIIGPEIKSWLQEELQHLDDPATYTNNKDEERYLKIKDAGSLNPHGLSILRELATWREKEARSLDRPRGHIVPDAVLLGIARKQLQDVNDIREGTSISARAADRYGEKMAAAVKLGLASQIPAEPPLSRGIKLTKKDQEALARLNHLIQLKGEVQGIDPAIIGNGSEFKLLVKILNKSCESKMLRQMEGWRKTFLKDFFRQAASR
ncbi:MAG: ribonuclease D [Desulfocapsaceae bacterium]|nr:ribonuclease D [Desulfocapsaceae bacterium]